MKSIIGDIKSWVLEDLIVTVVIVVSIVTISLTAIAFAVEGNAQKTGPGVSSWDTELGHAAIATQMYELRQDIKLLQTQVAEGDRR